MSDYRILVGDVRDRLKELDDESVQCVVTSPPYWGLRDYGDDDQLGLEPTPELYVQHMVEVFREVRRVLRADGTLWLNLGDSYASTAVGYGNSGGSYESERNWGDVERTKRDIPAGLKPKDLVGIPWRVAFALQSDGWWLRSDIIWAKPNPMPESVTDRPTKAHEYIFLLTKSARYYYDADAVREPADSRPQQRLTPTADQPKGAGRTAAGVHNPLCQGGTATNRNKRDVWTITTKPFPGAHFAVFPPELPTLCIKAGTSEQGCCVECGAPIERITERPAEPDGIRNRDGAKYDFHPRQVGAGQKLQEWMNANPTRTTGWQPTCECGADRAACVVLDPFAGAGTTGVVSSKLGRDFIGIELNPEYAEMARKRVHDAPLSLFAPGRGSDPKAQYMCRDCEKMFVATRSESWSSDNRCLDCRGQA